jgi:PHD/YefM family antitoxin component YafN of YafNO toxin-antitoxin module
LNKRNENAVCIYVEAWEKEKEKEREKERERERENLDVCEGTERFEDGFLFWIQRR